MSEYPDFDLCAESFPLVERVPVAPDAPFDAPQSFLDRLVIDVIHDGRWIPEAFRVDADGRPISDEALHRDYVRERDWGASLIAERIAARLGVPEFHRVSLARVLMDFGRFPGSTPRGADHLHRFAINYPFSELLSYQQKKELLETYYDGVSEKMDGVLCGKLVKIAIHTYDQFNESGTERPSMSLMTRSLGYQVASEMPAGLFDPLYPDVLAEFTADRILRDRISLTLEKAMIPVAHNYPYLLPEGSLEVRYQVWAYFNALRSVFLGARPETADDPAFELVWQMLLDTNLRSSDSEALRSFIHMYRRAPRGKEAEFGEAARAYEAIQKFSKDGHAFIEEYRFSPLRTSSLALEVRKDLVSELDAEGNPVAVRWDNVALIGDTVAKAISVYFSEDRAHHVDAIPDFGRRDVWWAERHE